MKNFNKVRKTIVPWIEKFQLATELSDPKNQAKLKKMSGEKLCYFAFKLGLYGLIGEVTGINDDEKCASILRSKLPQAATDRIEELRKKWPSIIKKLQSIKL